MELYDIFAESLPKDRLCKNEPMSRHTTFRVGGPAEVMFFPRGEEEISAAANIARREDCPVTFIGRGSNLIVRDGGIKGLVIRIGEEMGGISVKGEEISAKAGETLQKLSNAALEAGLTGLEFASGIPGSVGGAMAMNAGAYGGQMSEVTVSARLLDPDTGIAREYAINELNMSYRRSLALEKGLIVTKAVFHLSAGDRSEIKAKTDELNRRRREKQPLSYPSAGSVFKRPEGYFAGALIEQAGLKGLRIGGAEVSRLHAGFIINAGDATAGDVLKLIDEVKKRVYEHSGVTLEPEVRILGADK